MEEAARISERMTPLAKRYASFCLVGGTGVVVDMAVLYVLASPGLLHWNLTFSKVAAAELAIISNFILNELWTFGDLSGGKRQFMRLLVRFGKFNSICAGGVAISVCLLNLQVRSLGLNMLVANGLSIIVASVWNFSLNLRLAWGASR
jgi:dolichol-phosphate mannosyltransferase